MGYSVPARAWVLVLAALAVIAIWAWPRRTAPLLEGPPSSVAPPATLPGPARAPRPPQPAEVKGKVAKLFGDVVEWSEGDAFASGDFNSDGWNDLAAVVRPRAEQLPRLNQDPSNWIVQDPVAATNAKPGEPLVRPHLGPEPALVIVHGFDPAGWRSPDAQQTYVLKGVAAPRLEARPVEKAAAEAGMRAREDMTGDAIVEERAGGKGFLWWNGARYVWAPLPSAFPPR